MHDNIRMIFTRIWKLERSKFVSMVVAMVVDGVRKIQKWKGLMCHWLWLHFSIGHIVHAHVHDSRSLKTSQASDNCLHRYLKAFYLIWTAFIVVSLSLFLSFDFISTAFTISICFNIACIVLSITYCSRCLNSVAICSKQECLGMWMWHTSAVSYMRSESMRSRTHLAIVLLSIV